MQAFAPKVLVIEEAGQVMEAHVLSTLFPSVEHVIAIGDPLQLRPNINTYGTYCHFRSLPQNCRWTTPAARSATALT
jgi:superfamily I DNA and/or RNA helicase